MTTKPKPAKTGLEDAPKLVTHRAVAEAFGVSTTSIRRWVENREFPVPHAVIGQTWFYRADFIAHKLRTGNWFPDVKFRGDAGA